MNILCILCIFPIFQSKYHVRFDHSSSEDGKGNETNAKPLFEQNRVSTEGNSISQFFLWRKQVAVSFPPRVKENHVTRAFKHPRCSSSSYFLIFDTGATKLPLCCQKFYTDAFLEVLITICFKTYE